MTVGEVARQTPEQKLLTALREYAEASYPGKNVIPMDYVAVFYVEQVEADGTSNHEYLYVSRDGMPPHVLRGLVDRLHTYAIKSGG